MRAARDVRRPQPLGEAARVDRNSANVAQVDSWPARQRSHVAARDAVQHRDARAVVEDAVELVAEHEPGGGPAELLDVRAAQAAGADVHELARSGRLGELGELGKPVGVEDDRAHRRIVGGARGRDSPLELHRERDQPAGGDAAEQGLARLARPDEHRQQLLLRRGREERGLVHRQRGPAVRAGLASGGTLNCSNGTAVA